MSARILIVEDERITAEDLRDILTDLGYTVTASVSNGDEAIARAEETKPDLALMDIRIKGSMDGTETARILRDRFNIPVIYLTAHADATTIGRAKNSEPLGYITKPFREAELHASIEIALHKHQTDLKLNQHGRLLASTMEALAEGVISLDPNEIVTLINPAAEAWTGWPAGEALGKHVDEVLVLVDGVTGDKAHTPVWRVLPEGALADVPAGLLLVSRSGDKRPISGSISPIRDHRDEVKGAVMVFGRAVGDAAGSGPRLDHSSGEEGSGSDAFQMVAASPSMQQVLKFARRVAQSEVSTILLEGDSGTGKDVLAQFIHHFGRRSEGPFVALNCAAIPETLLESELFGYEKGAFTDARAPKAGILEIASGGTVFLDEIGEVPLVIQAKLLRVLEEQTFRRLGGVRDIQVDLRVVAATNRKLSEAIEQGRFRLDLYYRLNVIQVLLPPLRERAEDVLPLAEHFVRVYNTKFKRTVKGLSHHAAAAMLGHDWPGNVRELRNVIERAMVLEEGDWIQAANVLIASGLNKPQSRAVEQNGLAAYQTVGGSSEPQAHSEPFEVSLEAAEINLLKRALDRAGGNQTRAAVLLGVTRDTLRYKIKKFNLLR